MGKVRFASTCDVCGKRGPEYQVYPYCRECHMDLCPDCDVPSARTEDERNHTLCRACAALEAEDATSEPSESVERLRSASLDCRQSGPAERR